MWQLGFKDVLKNIYLNRSQFCLMIYFNYSYPIAVGGQQNGILLKSAIEVINQDDILFNLAIPRIQPVCLEIDDKNIFITGGVDLSGRYNSYMNLNTVKIECKKTLGPWI